MRSLFRSLAVCCALMHLAGCQKADDPETRDEATRDEAATAADVPAPAKELERGTVTEQHGDITVSWRVAPDGEVWGLVTQRGEEVKPSDVTGALEARALDDGQPTAYAVKEDSGLLHAKLPELSAAMTEIRYNLKVRGEPVKGVLHVPRRGTVALVEAADTAAAATAIKPGAKGPHGGVVQVVGDDVVEIVGKKGSGDVRVYLLDDDLKPVKVKKQKIDLVLHDQKTHMVELTRHEGDDYFYATDVRIRTNPKKVTVVIEEDGDHDVALVGYWPGAVFVCGHSAPVFDIYVVDSWDVVVVEDRKSTRLNSSH